jgi:biopolymer transport protein ExbD
VGQLGHLPLIDERLVLNVFRDGTITLNGRVVAAKELTAALRAARSNLQSPSVLVRGDGGGDFQTVARVLNACRQAGLSNLAIAVSHEPARR